MNESSVVISSIENAKELVYPNTYLNFFKATAIFLVIIFAISMIKGIKNKKYVVSSVIAVIMTIISYFSYNYILKNINAINGTEQLGCGFQIACSYIAMIVNGLLCIVTITFAIKGKKREELKHE
ncbi:MAG: hypothetical protein J6J36_08595 [Clostridia bacterium]|nr:hypothetical protein [Clostridia bacterium]